MRNERIPDITFELISDLQLDPERLTILLLDCANSLLEWDMFLGINPVRGMSTRGGQVFVPHLFLQFSPQLMQIDLDIISTTKCAVVTKIISNSN